MTALRLNMMRALGRAKRAKIRPAARPNESSPTSDSSVTTRSACHVAGVTSPYPIVAKVWTLKKKASEKATKADLGSRPSNASGPSTKKTAANAALAKVYETAAKARKRGHEISKRK